MALGPAALVTRTGTLPVVDAAATAAANGVLRGLCDGRPRTDREGAPGVFVARRRDDAVEPEMSDRAGDGRPPTAVEPAERQPG